MVPVVSVDQGTATLHATLPNGTVVMLTYPADLDLAGLGAQVYATVQLPDPAAATAMYQCCSYSVAFSYASVADLYPSATPASTYDGARGAIVRLFHPSQRRTPPYGDRADQLVFTFGRWVAEIPVVRGLQREPERIDLVANLHADIQPDGFPVLRESVDLRRGPEMGTGITFGDAAIAPQVRILTGFCFDPGSNTAVRRPIDHPGTESGLIWRDEDTKLLIEVRGPTTFTTVIGD